MDKFKIFNINKFHHLFLNIFKNTQYIFDNYANKTLKQVIFYKEGNEKFTSLDWVLQKYFEKNLENNFNFSFLKFIGEENTKETHLEITNEKMFTKLLSEFDIDKLDTVNNYGNSFSFLNDKKYISETNELNIEDCCLYVDPIDSTSSFIDYNFGPVTSLIGVTYKGKALLGIVFYPRYKSVDSNPVMFFNVPSKGVFKYSYKTGLLENVVKVKGDDQELFHFCISKPRLFGEWRKNRKSIYNLITII